MSLDKRAGAEPISGYRLIEPLGTGGFSEVWKCEAPGGIFKAMKFVVGDVTDLTRGTRADDELRAMQHIKSIRHPFLLSIERVENIYGELVIVTELADEDLYQLWQKYACLKQPGIPRQELLFYLRETAEVLDLLNLQSNLQHLDIKPRNLFLISKHVKVADFGLVQSLSQEQSSFKMRAISPLYAAPELFQGQVSRECDQYSLAIVYYQMLTGCLPFDGKNPSQLLLQHSMKEPNLDAAPARERLVLAKALSKTPNQRFECCMAFINALMADHQMPRFDAGLHITPSPFESDTHVDNTIVDDRTPVVHANPAPDVLPGYHFLESLAKGPLVETWRVRMPGSPLQLVYFVFGFAGARVSELESLKEHWSTLRHPALLNNELLHVMPGRLIFLGSDIRETLHDRCTACQSRGQPGIPRAELLRHLRGAAEVIDYHFHHHALQHLTLNPRNLVLDGGWLRIAEFGLAQLIWLASGQDIAHRNPRYAAPELLRGGLSDECDQFSLALTYAEMLTGRHPFQGQNPRKRGEPDLSLLPAHDKEVIARALHPDPTQRWPGATSMVLALEHAAGGQASPDKMERKEASRPRGDTLLPNGN